MPTAALKRLLPDVETELFYNWDDTGNEVSLIRIHFCNTSASVVNVWISVVELSGEFINGALFSEYPIPANDTLYIDIPKRVLAMDDSIRGYASVADVVSFSADLSGVSQSLIPSAEIP